VVEKIDESDIDWNEIREVSSGKFKNPVVYELNIPCD